MEQKKPLVLAIDDEADLNEITKEALSDLDIECETFEAPKDFLTRLKEAKPAACLIDRNIGAEDDGIAIIQAVRKIYSQSLPMLILSGAILDDEMEVLKEKGATDVIHKPTNTKILAIKLAPFFRTPKMEAILKTLGDKAPKLRSPQSSEAAQKYQPSKLMKIFVSDILKPMASLAQYLSHYEEAEARVEYYASTLREYEPSFSKMISSMRKGGGEDTLELKSAIRLNGLNNTRDLIVSLKLVEILSKKKVEWDENTHRPKIAPKEILQYAGKTVSHFGEDSRYRATAFRAGLIFDFLSIVSKKSPEVKKIEKLIEAFHEEALTVSDIAFKKAKESHLSLEMNCASIDLLAKAGKIILSIFQEKYLEWLIDVEGKSLDPTFQYLSEKKSFPLTHNVVAGMMSEFTPGVQDQTLALLFYPFPAQIKSESTMHKFDLCELYASSVRAFLSDD